MIKMRAERLLIAAIALSLVVFLIWASWAEIDQVTRVSGVVIPSSRNQVIQVMEQVMVDQIPVKEGDLVKKGQLLMRFEQDRTGAAYKETLAKVISLKATVARLSAELLGRSPQFSSDVMAYPEIVDNNRMLFRKRQDGLKEELQSLEDSLKLVDAELKLMQPLLATGDVSQVEILRLRRQKVDLEGRIVNRKNKYLEDSQAELSKARDALESLSQLLAQHRVVLQNTEIVAPMDGIVRNIRITTKGGVARAGEEIMQIVPIDDTFLIEAKVRPADIAFIKAGLTATVKFDAYDYTIYGSFPGEVAYISVDTLKEEARTANEEPAYRVQIRMTAKQFKSKGPEPVRIQPGMTATVEIRTGSNTVFKYLTKPIVKTLHESMGER